VIIYKKPDISCI